MGEQEVNVNVNEPDEGTPEEGGQPDEGEKGDGGGETGGDPGDADSDSE